MGLKKLALMIVSVRDYQAMKDWYSKVLGLEITEETDEGQWATFKLPQGDAEFAVHVMGESPRIEPAIEVEDIQATVEELRERGVEIIKEPRDPGHGQILADIRDPEGNVINLFQVVGR